jgi:hypothetical protein
MSFDVEFDIDPMVKRLDAIRAVQVPFATSLAINNAAKRAQADLKFEMRRVFDRPVPFTQNSIYIKYSKKDDLYARIGLKEFDGKGNAAADYLLPQIQGGPAYATRFQKSLRQKGILAPNEYARPTQSDYLRFNQYGNVTPGQYTQILYGLRAFRDSSAFAYRKNAKKKRAPVISAIRTSEAGIYRSRSLFPGIYLESKRARENQESALFWFGKTPNLPAKYNFRKIGSESITKNWEKEFGSALARAIATAK